MWLWLISSCLDVCLPASQGHLKTMALGQNCLQDYYSKKRKKKLMFCLNPCHSSECTDASKWDLHHGLGGRLTVLQMAVT